VSVSPEAQTRPKAGRPGRFRILLALLLGVYALQVQFLIREKSPVTDAVSFHLVNGYTYLKTRDFRMSPATPPLVREWMALPWLFWNPGLDLEHPSWEAADSVPFANHFFYEQHRELAPRLLAVSRWSVFLLGLALVLGVFSWSRRLWGPAAALAAATLAVFSPTFVGYSAIANIEIGIALFYFLTLFFLYRHHAAGTGRKYLWAAGAGLGAAMAAKYTGALLVPAVFYLCLRRRGWLRGIGEFALMSLIAFFVVWAAYFFEFKPVLTEGVPRIEEKIGYLGKISGRLFPGSTGAAEFMTKAAREMPVPLGSWVLGAAGIARSHQADYRHFFMGRWRDEQLWYHYLFSFAVKATLAFLLLLFLRVLWMRRIRQSGDGPGAGPYLLLAPGTLFLMTFLDTTGVGIRYLVPAFPLLWVWVSGLWAAPCGVWRKRFLAALLVLHAAAAIARFPHQVAYFNELIGGPSRAHRYVRANDLDWSQDYRGLAEYAAERGIKEMKAWLLGATDLSFYGLEPLKLSEGEKRRPQARMYAISVVHLEKLEWTYLYAPAAKIGHTIWVYDFRENRELQNGPEAAV